jgi:hypothetical protein
VLCDLVAKMGLLNDYLLIAVNEGGGERQTEIRKMNTHSHALTREKDGGERDFK